MNRQQSRTGVSTLSSSVRISTMWEILELATLLRKNGDKVLSGTSKLSLSTKLLHNLNDAFSVIVNDNDELDSSFQVCNSSKIDVFRDLKFLHDFAQKTVWLKVSQSQCDPRISVDISKFRHLKYLELQKVRIDLVSGIQGVRGQLESISCTGGGGVATIGLLLAACGRDAGADFVWASLKCLVLSYNGLGRLDKSLELVPWLQTLDLSHNSIVTTTELECLPSLKYVNLGYNKLEAAPTFNRTTYQTLQILVLKNNYIENLNGLQGLDCLTQLDLSYNCLTDHSSLWPFETMASLLWLSLEGNPLSYHKKHRYLTIKHLHSSLSESKFVLDHESLSKTEKVLVALNRTFMIRSACSPSKDDLASFTGSVTSEITSTSLNNIYSHDLTASQSSEVMDTARGRRRKYMQEAVITDDNHAENDSNLGASIVSASSLEMSTEHLETKKQILALREKVGGDNWLISHAGSFIQDIMGLERTSGSASVAIPGIITSSRAADMPSTNVSSTNVSSQIEVQSSSCDERIETIVENTGIDCQRQCDEEIKDNEEKVESLEASVTMEESEELPTTVDTKHESEEETGEVFLAQKKLATNEVEALFLIVTPENVIEQDSMNGTIKYKWSTKSVLSCVMGRGEKPTIEFIFDTARKDCQNRTYFVEQDDALKIVKTFEEIIRTRPILLKVFKCMRCSTHFSQDSNDAIGTTMILISGTNPPKCPTCRSTLVIETDELPTPDIDDVPANSQKMQVNHSLDEKRYALHEQYNDKSASTRDLHHSESHSSIGSATSLDESRESTPTASTLRKRYESDIEVLSNPSQSSIEVLDDASKTSSTPNRKRSSEERRIAIAPTLLTIPDTTPVMAGLTESSSSGSLTDSVCTAYENQVLESSGSARKRQNKKSTVTDKTMNPGIDKDTSNTPVSNLTSMLGGLLQSMKIGANKESLAKPEEKPEFINSAIPYSYTDFGSVDHRIKLLLVLNVFEEDNEELVMLLKAEIVMQSQLESFHGFLVLSTSKIYVLKICGTEREDPQRWLCKEESWTIDKLRSFAPLPFKQGIIVTLRNSSRSTNEWIDTPIACILGDIQHTTNFLLYLTDLQLPTDCNIDFNIQESCSVALHTLILSSKNHQNDDSIRFLALFSSATLTLMEQQVKLRMGGLIITTSSLLLLPDNNQWLLSSTNKIPNILTEQSISNLIEVVHDHRSLELIFLDEVIGVEETWRLVFVSSDAVQAVIEAIQPLWEALFSVPLQITLITSDSE